MTKKYIVRLPRPDRCTALGIKFEGNDERTLTYLLGVQFGVHNTTPDGVFSVKRASNLEIEIECDLASFMINLTEYLAANGAKVEWVASRNPWI